MKIHARDPLVGPRHEQLALHELLHRQHYTILDPKPDRGPRVLDGLVGILDLSTKRASVSFLLPDEESRDSLGRYGRRESRSRRRGRSLFRWRTGEELRVSARRGRREGDEANHGDLARGGGG